MPRERSAARALLGCCNSACSAGLAHKHASALIGSTATVQTRRDYQPSSDAASHLCGTTFSTGIDGDPAKRLASRFSGHSGRVGFVVAAKEVGAADTDIAATTRHRSLQMIKRYGEAAEQRRERGSPCLALGSRREGGPRPRVAVAIPRHARRTV
jgi:hypothetical protein